MKKVYNSFNWIVTLLVLRVDAALAQACPVCKLSLLNSPEGRHLAKAFNGGILFLLAMPYLIAMILAATMVLLRRRRRTS